MIKKLSYKDKATIYDIINEAAHAYKGAIPEDRYHEPYMPEDELDREMSRMTFFGWKEGDKMVGVMGAEPVKDVTLLRHAYVLPDCQGRGVGSRLLDHVKRLTTTKQLLVGTWAGATWAVDFYKKRGFELVPNKDDLLRKYWDVPPRQIETSVVLAIEI